MGDPAGIGPEIIAKTLRTSALRQCGKILIIGDSSVFQRYQTKFPGNCTFLDLKLLAKNAVRPGRGDDVAARASLGYLHKAVQLLQTGTIHALVTAPVSKENISALGHFFQGHTEFLAQAFRCRHVEMMFVARNLRVILLTRHIPITQVSSMINKKSLLKTIRTAHATLLRHFKIKNPRIAVCGLNPHASEGGRIGDEEQRYIQPAVSRAREDGINVSGPFAADTLFAPHNSKNFDLIIAMYHDQGLIGIKSLYFDDLVNTTIGLPFVRTSPAHGTAFNIAGKNKAHPGSLLASIKLAAQLMRAGMKK